MTRRKRLTTGLLLLALLGMGTVGGLLLHRTSPATIRRQVLAQLRDRFPGASVQLGSAHLRLLGGIAITDLRLSRHDDPAGAVFLHVPAGVIYHDKEQLACGRLAIRKVELQAPRLTVRRDPAGHWNLAGILAPTEPGPAREPIPTLVVRQGQVAIEDARIGRLPTEVTGLDLTLLNDPLPTVTLQAQATAEPLGGLRVQGTWQRADAALAAALDLPAVPIGPALVQELARHAPALAEHARQLEGTAAIHLDVTNRPGRAPRSDWYVHLRDGRWRHPQLPLPLDQLEVVARCRDGTLTVERASARAGSAGLRLSLEIPLSEFGTEAQPTSPNRASRLPLDSEFPSGGPPTDLERQLRKFDLVLEHLTLGPELFERLPASVRDARAMFDPAGRVSLEYHLDRQGERWCKQFLVRPESASASYVQFPYPLTDLTGTVEHRTASDAPEVVRIDVAARAGGRPVRIVGQLDGDGSDRAIRLDIRGDNLPLDETMLAALPANYQALARSFRPSGRGDVTAAIRRERGGATHNHYRIRFHDTRVCYDVFPYPLDDVSGTLEIDTAAPGGWRFTDFQGRHGGGRVKVSGHNEPGPGGDALVIDIAGVGVGLDAAFARALDHIGMASTWQTLTPSGQLDFTARVRHTEAPPVASPPVPIVMPPRPPGLDVSIEFVRGANLRPDFFPYLLTDLSGKLHYTPGRVELGAFRARHGPVELSVGGGLVLRKLPGGVWADLKDLRLTPLRLDADFLAALPPGLRAGCAGLELTGPMSLHARQLVVDTGDPGRSQESGVRSQGAGLASNREAPPTATVYWDASLFLQGATLQTGVPWEGVVGQIACRGVHDGERVKRLIGNVAFDRAFVYRQPLTQVHAHFEDDEQNADVLKFYPQAKLYGGDVAGEARLTLAPALRYDVKLTASQVRLEDLARQNRLQSDAQLSGLATAQFHLAGGDGQVMEGGGSIDVPAGKLYNLPLLLDLLKVLNLHAPDRTAFEEAHARLHIRGQRVHVTRLDLMGNAISVGGQGELNLDGTDARLSFYALWSRALQLLPVAVRERAVALSKGLFKIEVRGDLGGDRPLDFKEEAVPALTDPLKQLREQVRARGGLRGGLRE